jgi:hypothetical protein
MGEHYQGRDLAIYQALFHEENIIMVGVVRKLR